MMPSSSRWIPSVGIPLFFLLIIFAGWLAPHDAWERFDPFQSPSRGHLLGTNDMGNDVFSELLVGGRVTIITGITTACIATLLGVVVGMTAGYFRGVVEDILMGFTDVILMVPRIPVVIIFAAFMRPSFWTIILVLGLLWWPSTARVVRAKTMQVREAGFVEVNTCMGISVPRIILTDIFPNLFEVIIPKYLLTVASAMVSEASISFLGLGDPTVKSWGTILNYAFNRGGFWNGMWWWYLPPGVCIVMVVLAVRGMEQLMHRDPVCIPEEGSWESRSSV